MAGIPQVLSERTLMEGEFAGGGGCDGGDGGGGDGDGGDGGGGVVAVVVKIA